LAAGNFVLLNIAKIKLVNGTFDLNNHVWKAVLAQNSWSPTEQFLGTSGNAIYSDLRTAGPSSADVEISDGNGYATGGVILQNPTLIRRNGLVTFTTSIVAWANSLFRVKYVVVYSDTCPNKDILGYMDLNTDSTSAYVFPINETLAIVWNSAGMFTIS
jgi:hypothetical protein